MVSKSLINRKRDMKHLITLAFLIAAIVVAMAGYVSGFVILVVAGLLLEGIFWHRVFRKRKS